MKTVLKKLKRLIMTFQCYRYDAARYLKSTQFLYTGNETQDQKLPGRILAHAHCIEKGLALPEPRQGFGQPMIKSLIQLLTIYRKNGLDPSATCYQMALGAFGEYKAFHADCPELIASVVDAYEAADLPITTTTGGTVPRTAAQMNEASQLPFGDFAFSRHSVREYAPKEVEMELINKAVGVAQRSPSVCNRQGSRVHVLSGKELQGKALAYQNGNRGFGSTADKILIVTVDMTVLHGLPERNQAFVDGGMFAMSLVYALTHLGLASCCLNWSANLKNDRGLRSLGFIPNNEVVIMFISVGHYPEEFKVAVSPRLDTDSIIKVH